ncbi:MAG TPA: hypothetical protein VHI54_11665 [Actinomycetota bacterium]|nr:hypothetical protein [Actinomycetota bacterium]
MRVPRLRFLLSSVLVVCLLLISLATSASAQEVQLTPEPSITPSTEITAWLRWMALGAMALTAVVVLGLAAGYMRFAPKFFGRDEPPKRLPPGARPPLLSRTQAARSPVGSTRPPVAQSPSGRTGRGEPVAPASRPAPAASGATAAAASATATAERATPAAAQPTAGPSTEPAVQADATGEAEARAPEPRPTAKTREDAAVEPEDVTAQAPTTAETAEAAEGPGAQVPAGRDPAAEATAQPPAQPAPTTERPGPAEVPPPAQVPAPQTAPAAPAPGPGVSELDQETFDRVLQEQLSKGVDKRVAEGRARAAAVVAARKKSQS